MYYIYKTSEHLSFCLFFPQVREVTEVVSTLIFCSGGENFLPGSCSYFGEFELFCCFSGHFTSGERHADATGCQGPNQFL